MTNKKINLNEDENILECEEISVESHLNTEEEEIISDGKLREESISNDNNEKNMITEVKSDEIINMKDAEKIKYLEKNVFKSKFSLGRVNKIIRIETGDFARINLVLPYDVNTNYKIDGKEWVIYCGLNDVADDVKENLKKGDLIYFKPIINTRKPEEVIKVNGSTAKKMINYKEFLKKANIDFKDVKIQGLVALEKEEDVRVWVTEEFYRNFSEVHEDLLVKIKEDQNELEDIRKEKERTNEAIENAQKIAHEKIENEQNKLITYENELKEKENEIERLISKLEYFGFKSFKRDIEDSVPVNNLLNYTFNEIFEYIKSYLKYNKKLIYSDDIIRRFLGALQSNELIILSGPSGTGKTSIVTAFAEAIGGLAKIISVKPSWTETEDLIGFYNPIEKSYISTPFLDALVEAKKDENKDKLYLICLDEMNLSHVEYYFAEFLSKLEINKNNPSIELYSKEIFNEVLESIVDTIDLISGEQLDISVESIKKWCEDNSKVYTEEIMQLKKKIKFIEKYPAIFSISSNVRFVGTVNIDQTTKSISPKVIDRSFIIELLKFGSKVEDIKGEKVEEKFIPAYTFNLNSKEELSEQSMEIINELDLTNQVLEILDCDYNSRTYKHISEYLSNLEQWEIEFDKSHVLSDLIAMKILPRINASSKNKTDEKYVKWIELKNILDKKCSDDVRSKISKMDRGLEEDNILSFWGVY